MAQTKRSSGALKAEREWIAELAARGIRVNGNAAQQRSAAAMLAYKKPRAATAGKLKPTDLRSLAASQRRIIDRIGADKFFVCPNPFEVRA